MAIPTLDELAEEGFPRIVAIDASCQCGASIHGAWDSDDIDAWIAEHDHPTPTQEQNTEKDTNV